MIQATAMAWASVLERHGLDDPERDAPRILRAFEALMDTCHQWPPPRALIENLPELSRPYFHALPKPEQTPEEQEAERLRRRAIVEQASKELHIPLRNDDA
jgi:hypothetical protein